MGCLKLTDSQCSVQAGVFLTTKYSIALEYFLWSLGCSHGNIWKGRVVLLPELCSLKKQNKEEIWGLSQVYLTSFPCQTGLETHENICPVRLLVLPAPARVGNVTSTSTAFHVVFHVVFSSLLPGSAGREMLKIKNHRRGWKETQRFLVHVLYLLLNLHFCKENRKYSEFKC